MEQHGSLWRGAEYAESAAHHRQMDEWFLERLPPGPADVVVDLGAGTGEFTARLAQLVPAGRVIGVEPDSSMLEVARRRAADNLEFVSGKAQELDQVLPPDSADQVVSRAMLHWIPLPAYPRVFRAVRTVLRPGGWYHSESGGAGNVPRVLELLGEVAGRFGLPAPSAFPDPGVVFELLEQAGFEIPQDGVRSVSQRRPFDRGQIETFLRAQAAVALTRQAPPEMAEALVEATVEGMEHLRRWDGTFDQTFVRLEILVRRPA